MDRKLKTLCDTLRTPYAIQQFIDQLEYSADSITRSAAGVAHVERAHCFDGALFAAAMFEANRREPLLLDLRSNGNDDDHVIAVYKYRKHYGAVAKSNFVGLRFREPVYRSLRELALSYFNSYFNLDRERTLVEYSRLVSLRRFTEVDWRHAGSDVDIYRPLASALDRTTHYRLFPKAIERSFQLVDRRLLAGETVGMNTKGVFRSKCS